jgi:uncharacterized cupredoxin-like copper-binding protein
MPLIPTAHHRIAPTIAIVAFALLLAGCAQSVATTITSTPRPTQSIADGASVDQMGPILGTVEVWLDEFGILLWTPAIQNAGAYRFEVTNRGRQLHDFTLVRAPPNGARLPSRSGRAQLQQLEVLARSTLLDPRESITIDANLGAPGTYIALSSYGTDYGDGMVTTLRVGQGNALAVPQPTPAIAAEKTVAVYLVDDTIFLSNDVVPPGVITLLVQNIGPSPHELQVVRWRGDQSALPVDERGELLIDALIVVGQVPVLAAGASEELMLELSEDYNYVLLSSLPGDYSAGLNAQILTR